MTRLLDLQGVSKAFDGVPALRNADLAMSAGEVHALVGQNGAGKSTLIKILSGALRRDGGTILLDGQPVDFASPPAAQRAGIATIHQEIVLVGLRSVAENIFLGHEPTRFGLLDRARMRADSAELLRGLGLEIDVSRPLASYNVAVRQLVAVARAIGEQARLVIMDEATSSLDDREVETLLGVVRQLRDRGVGVIFISHRLDELYGCCECISILRDGETVFQGALAGLGKHQLVSRMLGRDEEELDESHQTAFARRQSGRTQPLLSATNLRAGVRLRDVSVEVGAGEVIGLGGLLGAGRSEAARAIFGADRLQGGSVTMAGRSLRGGEPREAIGAGIGFCPEDRKVEGIVPDLSLRENLTLALLPRLTRLGVVDAAAQARVVDEFIARLGIKTAGPEQPIRELSGGNQQKVLLARWLCMQPRLLILDEPTRGIDVGAKGEIQRLIDELACSGLGVLMISSEPEELVEGSNRVTVLREGQSVCTLEGDELSESRLVAAMAGGEAEARPATTEGAALVH